MDNLEIFFWIALIWFGAYLLLDIRARLPRSESDRERYYLPPSLAEGFQMRLTEVSEGDMDFGFDGSWSKGLYIDLVGEVIPYHDEYREKQKFRFEGTQTIRVHATDESFDSTQIGNAYKRIGRPDDELSVHIFLPVEFFRELSERLLRDSKRFIEIDIGENLKKGRNGEPTYGVYRFVVREHF